MLCWPTHLVYSLGAREITACTTGVVVVNESCSGPPSAVDMVIARLILGKNPTMSFAQPSSSSSTCLGEVVCRGGDLRIVDDGAAGASRDDEGAHHGRRYVSEQSRLESRRTTLEQILDR